MRDFVARHALGFTNLADDSGDVFARFGVPYQPAWAFVASDGSVTTSLGALGPDGLAVQLARLAGR
jgi:hypothetical protein